VDLALARGQTLREPGGPTEAAAQKKLCSQFGSGNFVGLRAERVTVDEILDDSDANLEKRGVRSLDTIRCQLKPVREWQEHRERR
jgi:hypothetical protein